MLNKLDLPTWVGDALKGMALGGLIFLGLALLCGRILGSGSVALKAT